jgi:hypothetical protein
MIRNNVFMNLNRVNSGDYAFPSGNTVVGGPGEIGFADLAAKDFRLTPASKYRGRGSGGKDMGSDVSYSDLYAIGSPKP